MEADELRIGNYVNHSELGVVEVIAVGKNYIHCIFNGETHYESIGHFSPIPLSEEWLNKLGFQLDQYIEIESLVDEVDGRDIHLEMEYGERGTVICLSSDELDQSLSIPLKHINYVHQFQNLFFALKGKELTVTSK